MESLRSSKRIKLIVTRHEQAAAMMAATVGRLTGPQPPDTLLLCCHLLPDLITGLCMSALLTSGRSLPGQSLCMTVI